MPTLTLARHLMGTRCEIVLCGDDPVRLRAAGEEALAEMERTDGQLSLFRDDSEVAGINAGAGRAPVRVSPDLFALLALCRDLCRDTDGAFDVTIGPLLRCWGFRRGQGRVPSARTLAAARACVGSEHLLLDPEALSVRFARPGVELDLGGIGKGVAVDRAVKTLKGLGVESALLHAGTSSVCAIGRPPGGDAWPVAIRDPEAPERSAGTVRLCNAALSVSGAHGRFFEEDGERYGHVMDPRTGGPSQGARQAAVVHPSATVAEGLSTALLVAGAELLPRVRERWPEAECRLL